MATVKVMLKENKVNERGEMPVYIRITKDRKARFMSLGINVHPDLWDATNLRVKKQYPNSVRVNAFIAKKVAEATGVELDLRGSKQYVSSQLIKETIKGKPTASLLHYAEEYIAEQKSKKAIATYKKVKTIVEKLRIYLKGKDILFQEFDVAFLKKYEAYLRDDLKNSPNTVHTNLKTFRKLFNDAAREDLIEPYINPFLKHRIKTEKTKRGYLTEQEIEAINALELPERGILFHHRNMFVFACYAGGIRVSDMLQLRWENYDGTHVRLFMQKTKDYVSIKLPEQAQKIIEYYLNLSGGNARPANFIFPIFNNSTDYSEPEILYNAISRHTAHINKNLKHIAIEAKIDKHISFHLSRHSFGTLALKKGIGIEYVSRLMGHHSIKTTLIYAKIADKDLDKAMDAFV